MIFLRNVIAKDFLYQTGKRSAILGRQPPETLLQLVIDDHMEDFFHANLCVVRGSIISISKQHVKRLAIESIYALDVLDYFW